MDTLARWGGEEFCVLLPNATLDMALVVAERIRMSVESTNMKAPDGALHEGHATVSLTVSIGAAVYDSKNHDAQDIIQRADHKLFEAKRAGRNRVM
jgi:diguanylate cyclase (GGDEF)-like protein